MGYAKSFYAVETSFRASTVLSILGLLLFTLSDPSQSLPTPWGSILPDWTKGPLRPHNDSLVYTFKNPFLPLLKQNGRRS